MFFFLRFFFPFNVLKYRSVDMKNSLTSGTKKEKKVRLFCFLTIIESENIVLNVKRSSSCRLEKKHLPKPKRVLLIPQLQ